MHSDYCTGYRMGDHTEPSNLVHISEVSPQILPLEMLWFVCVLCGALLALSLHLMTEGTRKP